MDRNTPTCPLSERYLDKENEGQIASTSSNEDTLESPNADGSSAGLVPRGKWARVTCHTRTAGCAGYPMILFSDYQNVKNK